MARPWYVLLCCLLACGGSNPSREHPAAQQRTPDPPKTGPPKVVLHDTVLQTGIKRFGMNISQATNYGTGQIVRNLIRRNPGFEGTLYRSIVEIERGGTTDFVDRPPAGAWPDHFWDGATYEVIWGKARGRRGKVIKSTKEGQSHRYQCDGQGPAFAEGDQVVLRKSAGEPATSGWWPKTKGKGRFAAVGDDGPPETEGAQSLLMEAATAEDVVQLHTYFDPPKGRVGPMAPLNGRYVLAFWARAKSRDARLEVSMTRHVQPNRRYLKETVALSQTWQFHRLVFEAGDDRQQGVVELSFRLQGGSCLLDEVRLEPEADGLSPVFRDEVVSLLERLRPGILRYWVGQLGDSLENQLAGAYGQRLSGYSRWGKDGRIIGFSLPEFLSLCERLNAEVWYVVPLTFTRAERLDLIEYLAGDVSTPMGALRAGMGHPEPWTERLGKIHLEMGNEAWNGTFKGGILERPEVYGQVCDTAFADFRGHRDFDPASFQLIIGGQAVWAGRNKTMLKQTRAYDSLALAPYLMHTLEQPAERLLPLAQLFAEVAGLGKGGYLVENRDLAKQLDQPVSLSVYEVNLHTTGGGADEATLVGATAGAGAAVGVAAHMLGLLSDFGVRDICFYNFNQYGFKRPDKQSVPLWGAINHLGPMPIKRPQFFALEMMNQALAGDQLVAQIGGRIPAFTMGSFQIEEPVRVFAFRDGETCSLLALNLDLYKEVTLALETPWGQPSNARHRWLAFDDPLDHNENEIQVTLKEDVVARLENLTIGPSGFHLWQWRL